MPQPALASPPPPIAGRYVVDPARSLTGAGGGLPAFAAADLASRTAAALMAVQVERRRPPRALALRALETPIEGVLAPLAHGPAPAPGGAPGYYLIAPAPPGPPLGSRLRPWPEHELLEQVLRPAARSLDRLARLGVTHRAIRPDNVFLGGPGGVVLGMAWAAPAALHQPAIAEPPYVIQCLPAGRGDGSIADDVYALGVLLLTLARGQAPLAGLDDATILQRKLERGSFAALAGDARLPPVIADLVRAMLAEDPEHRPSPALLTEPSAARARKVAARPPRQAQRAIQIAGQPVANARLLAHALAAAPEQGLPALRAGAVDDWLRRHLGDAVLAARLEDAMRVPSPEPGDGSATADATAIMCAVAVLDPLAPLCWRGIALWPDGFGPALAAADDWELLIELTTAEAVGTWARARAERCDAVALQAEARRRRGWFTGRGQDGLERVLYALNPLLPCASPRLADDWVIGPAELLPALERAAGRTDRGAGRPIDRHLAALVATRLDRRSAALAELTRTGGCAAVADLRLLAELQLHFHPAPLPGLAAWLTARPEELLAHWRSQRRRNDIAQRLPALAEAGQLAAIVRLVQDPAAQVVDLREAEVAAGVLARIDADLANLDQSATSRTDQARRWGQELVAGLGLVAAAAALFAVALG